MKNTYFRGLAQTGAFQVKKQASSNNLFRLKTLEFWLRAISARDVTRMPEEYLLRILKLSSRELCESVVRELENRELEKSKKKTTKISTFFFVAGKNSTWMHRIPESEVQKWVGEDSMLSSVVLTIPSSFHGSPRIPVNRSGFRC